MKITGTVLQDVDKDEDQKRGFTVPKETRSFGPTRSPTTFSVSPLEYKNETN